MVVKFFGNTKGGSGASVDYLLNEREEAKTARTLQGDPKLTKELIRSIERKQKVCVGCLSFEEANIPEADKYKLMEEFEKTLLPDMQGRYNILWVEHTDKGRLELNFVIPRIDLETGKGLSPYYHASDAKGMRLFQQVHNLENGWSDPQDPSKERTLQGATKKLELQRDYEQLDTLLHNLVKEGAIQNRTQLIETLEASKINVTRKGQDSISVKLPESLKARKLKGGIYAEQFRSLADIETISDRAEERVREYNQRDTQRELTRAKQELDEHTQYKARELQRQYPRRDSREPTHKNVASRELNSSRSVADSHTLDVVHNQDNDVGSTQELTHSTRGQTLRLNRRQSINPRYENKEQTLLEDRRKLDDIARADATRRARERETAQLLSLEAIKAEPNGIYRGIAKNFSSIRERNKEDYTQLRAVTQRGISEEQRIIREVFAERSGGISSIKERFNAVIDHAKEFIRAKAHQAYQMLQEMRSKEVNLKSLEDYKPKEQTHTLKRT